MKHFRLKFNHGVEIGARLAYLGHYIRTGDKKILQIAAEEFEHQQDLRKILQDFGEETCFSIDTSFALIGRVIFHLCAISPRFMLNFVAMALEAFAVFSYNNLSKAYPRYYETFQKMSRAEEEHRIYFKGL
jgi:rubrerythrin